MAEKITPEQWMALSPEAQRERMASLNYELLESFGEGSHLVFTVEPPDFYDDGTFKLTTFKGELTELGEDECGNWAAIQLSDAKRRQAVTSDTETSQLELLQRALCFGDTTFLPAFEVHSRVYMRDIGQIAVLAE